MLIESGDGALGDAELKAKLDSDGDFRIDIVSIFDGRPSAYIYLTPLGQDKLIKELKKARRERRSWDVEYDESDV